MKKKYKKGIKKSEQEGKLNVRQSMTRTVK